MSTIDGIEIELDPGLEGMIIGVLVFSMVLVLMLVTVSTLYFPIRDFNTDQNMYSLTFFLCVFAFPFYLALMVYQNPLKLSGRDSYILLILLYFVFFPGIFCVVDRNNWKVAKI